MLRIWLVYLLFWSVAVESSAVRVRKLVAIVTVLVLARIAAIIGVLVVVRSARVVVLVVIVAVVVVWRAVVVSFFWYGGEREKNKNK